MKIVDKDGNPPRQEFEEITDADGNKSQKEKPQPFPINGLLHSLWQGIEVTLGETILTEAASLFPYRAYIKSVLHRTPNETAVKELFPELYSFDSPGSFDDVSIGSPNEGAFWRQEVSDQGKSFVCIGPLLTDVTEVDKYIFNGVPLTVRLIPSRPEFCIMSSEPEKRWRLHIEQVSLKVKMVNVTPAIISAHSNALNVGDGLFYYKKSMIVPHPVGADQQSFVIENAFLGRLPEILVITMVSDRAYNGDYELSPWNFATYDLQSIGVYIDGMSVPYEPYELDIGEKHIQGPLVALHRSFKTRLVTFDSFTGGYCLLVFDLRSGKPDSKDFSLSKSGTLSIHGKFKTKLPVPIQVLCYGEFQSCFTITKSRVVHNQRF